jgi:hypothetical protein
VRSVGLGGNLFGIGVTAVVAAVAWFGFGHKILDKATKSAADSQTAGVRQFSAAVAKVRRQVGAGGRLVSVTLRPSSAEFVTSADGRVARALRWDGGDAKLKRFEENAPIGNPAPWPIAKLDPRAPKRIFDSIGERERGDFQLSIGDLQRASTGRLVWTMRGTIGERGVAYTASPDGRGVALYNPASPQLSSATRLTHCIQRANNDPARVQRCVARFKP